MKVNVLTAVVAVLLGASPVLAQEFQFTSYNDIEAAYQSQNQEISHLRARLAALEDEAPLATPEYGAAYGGCCNSGCGSCCDSCCDMCCDTCCSTGCGWVAGGGVMFLKPHWDSNPAIYEIDGNALRNVDFDHDFEAAPFGWVGYVGDTGFGVRARWFEFDHSSDVSFIGNGDQALPFLFPIGLLTADLLDGAAVDVLSNLNLDVWDFEATQTICHGCWTWQGSAGVRYLHISQRYDLLAGPPTSVPLQQAVFTSGHNFNGVGPTLSLEGRRAVGCTGLSFYGNARGSILFGESEYDAVIAGGLAFDNPPVQLLLSSWAPVSIVELELGADYRVPVGMYTFFARGALVGQFWQGVGNAAAIDSSGIPADRSANLGLWGTKTEVGIAY
jgi:hypothetical protein